MKVKYTPLIPRSSTGFKGLLLEKDLKIHRHARLRAKLAVFDSNKNLRKFWSKVLYTTDLGDKTMGAVNALDRTCIRFLKDGSEESHVERDPVYFCLIGLIKGHLSMEIICHESVHAGFALMRRKTGVLWAGQEDMPEESVCYPAGAVASLINLAVAEANLYDP